MLLLLLLPLLLAFCKLMPCHTTVRRVASDTFVCWIKDKRKTFFFAVCFVYGVCTKVTKLNPQLKSAFSFCEYIGPC